MDDEVTWNGSSNNKGPTIILIAIAAAIIGSIAGMVGHSVFSEPVVVIPPPEVIKEELTETELRALAGSFLLSTGANEFAGRFTRGHFDLPMRNCSIWLDERQIIEKGVLLPPLAFS